MHPPKLRGRRLVTALLVSTQFQRKDATFALALVFKLKLALASCQLSNSSEDATFALALVLKLKVDDVDD